jgi:hypothetical protein
MMQRLTSLRASSDFEGGECTMLFLPFLILLAGATSPSMIAEQKVGAAESSATQSGDTKIVCRIPEPVVGSRLRPKRVCMTQADWKAAARNSQAAWERRYQAPSGTPK